MKKHISIFLLVALLIIAVFPVTAFAASASASLTGPGTVRAGDTITVSFNLNGSGIYGVSGSLSYDSSQVSLTNTTQKIASPWAVEFNGNSFVAYDNNLDSPINGNKTVFTATFTVTSVAAGTKINISCTGVTASDGSADVGVGTVTYSATIAEPLSTNCELKSLTVSNATISPAFSAGTTSYTASVPYEVSKLNVTATAADGKAKVSVDSPTLTVNGTTKVSVTVTAESGATKTYTISVKRAQDPNYVPSGKNDLSDIKIDGFMLSPGFSADEDEYVVWLPYEVDSIKVSGSAADGKATVEVVGGDNLVAGEDNIVKVICIAENGEKKEYTIIAKRAAEHGTDATQPSETDPTDPTDPSETEPGETKPGNAGVDDSDKNCGIAWWWLVVVGIATLAIGGVGGYYGKDFIEKKKR